MAKLLQFEANRGAAGKPSVSLNALRDGLRARAVVLPGEDRDQFHQLCGDLETEWQPQSRTEQFYLEQMVVSQWKLTRMEVDESVVRERFTYIEEQLPHLDRLWQAQCRMERSYARAKRELERLQHSRRRQVHQQPEEPAPQPDTEAPTASSDPQPAGSAPSIETVASTAHESPAVFPDAEPDPRTAGRPHPPSSAGSETPPGLIRKCPKTVGCTIGPS